jgi:hypothetical protein
MDSTQAREILNTLSSSERAALSDAHLRYMHFTGVYTSDISNAVIAQDRATYPHLLKFDEAGRPSLSDQRCADFMVALTGLPREWCFAWDEVDFVETHGEDFFEMQFKLQESDRLAHEAGTPTI